MRKAFEGLSTQEINQVRMYGTTEAAMRESIERSTTFKFSGAEMIVAGMLSDAQEMFAYNKPDANTIEEHRQLMNRAKWALFEYMSKETA
jgi:cystathionine beta-lyase/cystathionine gamma-synthase